MSFKSSFDRDPSSLQRPPQFVPPEAFGAMMDEEADLDEMVPSNAWDVATRYHEFKSMRSMKQKLGHIRRLSAQAILERAMATLGSVVHPVDLRVETLDRLPGDATHVELDLDETVDQSALELSGARDLTERDILMAYQVHRRQPLVLSVDTSLSMTGEKLALTAVALAVVLLQFPDDPIGIVAFENESKIIKRPDERISLQQMVERFLDVPAQGYTHLEDGMRSALKLSLRATQIGRGRPTSTVLLTDGKYTAGRDPSYLAPRFSHLVVLKMGRERASLELCRELARDGHGSLREVGDLETLPSVMYGVVKDLLRGRSVA